MTAPVPDPTMQEAEAWVAYLRQYVVNNPDRDLETAVEGIAAVIRALMEQVKYVQGLYDNEIANANKHDDCVFERDQRIAALEAENQELKGRLESEEDQHLVDLARAERDIVWERTRFHSCCQWPTPAEIAARVEQNREEDAR